MWSWTPRNAALCASRLARRRSRPCGRSEARAAARRFANAREPTAGLPRASWPLRPPSRRQGSTPIFSTISCHGRLPTSDATAWCRTRRAASGRSPGAALETPEPGVQAPAPAARLRELQLMPYRDYLRTLEWRRTRAAALARAGPCSSLDETHTEDLEVPPGTYERLGPELASALVVLCRNCPRM